MVSLSPNFRLPTPLKPQRDYRNNEPRGSRLIGIVGTLVIIIGMMSFGSVAAAESATSTVESPSQSWTVPVTISGTDILYNVTCVTASYCMAWGTVGGYNNSKSIVTFTDNGGKAWSVPVTVLSGGFAYDVSCASILYCIVVGQNFLHEGVASYTSNGGKTWSSPVIISDTVIIDKIYCVPATGYCIASGTGTASASNSSAITVYTLNLGKTWSSPATIYGMTNVSGISCTAVTYCVAIGSAGPLSTPEAVAAYTSDGGRTWSADVTVSSPDSSLQSISCPISSYCIAVGTNTSSKYQSPFSSFTTDGGKTWSTPVTIGGMNGALGGGINYISCLTATYCVAVGWKSTSTTEEGQAVYTSDGGNTWTTPVAISGTDILYAISCPTSSYCVVVGGGDAVGIATTYSIPLPAISSVTPSSAPVSGRTTITITGDNLEGATAVHFGSTPAASFGVVSATTITATAPSVNVPGATSITVTTSQGTSSPIGFVYTTPNISYTPVTPYRIADTRCTMSPPPAGISTSYCSSLPPANQTLSSPPAGGSITLQVTGTGSAPITSSAQSVVLNVTAVASPSAHSGYLTVYPAGTNPPMASSLNYTPGATVPNLVTATLGKDGAVSIYSSSANVNVVVDVEGYYIPSTESTYTTRFTPLASPARLLDTRCATSAKPSYCNKENLPSVNASIPAPGPTTSISITVTGIRDIPLSATAVSLVVTAAGPSSSGYLTTWDDSGSCTSPPISSNVNFVKVSSSAGSVIVATGGTGKICIYNSSSTPTNVVVDITGWFSQSGDTFSPTSPVRICDTRSVSQIGGSVDVASGVSGQCENSGTTLDPTSTTTDPLVVQVTGIAGIPLTATAVVANITVVSTSGGGYLTAWATGSTQPTTSNINWGKGSIVANMVVSALDSSGQMDIYTSGTANVIVDVMGWYS